MDEYAIELKKESMEAINYMKEPNESFGSIIQRSLQLLYYFTRQQDEGFTQVFLRNPEEQKVKRMKVKYENS